MVPLGWQYVISIILYHIVLNRRKDYDYIDSEERMMIF